MQCSKCEHLSFVHGKHQYSHYFCTHPEGAKAKYGYDDGKVVVVERCEPGSDKLTMKYAPKWCPINSNQNTKKEEAK